MSYFTVLGDQAHAYVAKQPIVNITTYVASNYELS